MEIVSFAIDWALPLLWTRHDSLDGRGSYVSSSTPWRLAGWIRLKSGWQPWRLEYMINDIWHMTHYMWYCVYIYTHIIYITECMNLQSYVYIYIHHISGMSWFIWHCNEKMMCVFFRPARITGLTAFAQKWGRKLPLFDSELNVQLWHLVSLMVLFCFREHMNTYAETHGWMDGWWPDWFGG